MPSLKHFDLHQYVAFTSRICIKNSHTDENRKTVNTLSPAFSIHSHILRYLLIPWKKELTFRTTENRKKRKNFFFFFFWRMKCFLSQWNSYVSSLCMRPASWIAFGIIGCYLQKLQLDRFHLPPYKALIAIPWKHRSVLKS